MAFLRVAAMTYVFRHAGRLGIGPAHYSLWAVPQARGWRRASARTGRPLRRRRLAPACGCGDGLHRAFGGRLRRAADLCGRRRAGCDRAAVRDGAACGSPARAGTAVEFHRYPNAGHGFGRLGTGTSAEGWVRAAIRFWERVMPKR
jgi:hypothetical protein